MFGPKKMLAHKNEGPQKLVAKSLVKIGSVTAEIFLLWINVTKTNVALTNITVADGICSGCSQKPTFKFCPNFVSNSLDIACMERCCQDNCCLDKCHRDSCHLLKMVPGTYNSSLVKIGSITAEILLIWKNFGRTNIIITLGIC